jgi:hypothetical protein
MIVFLTDGKPTWPIGSTAANIIDSVNAINKDSVAIYTFGIGDSLDFGFLRLLARNNGAFFQQITIDDSINLVMKRFMEKVSYPLMRNVKIDCGDLSRYDCFPRNIPNIYSGTQLVQFGRYRNTGEFSIKCSGNVGSEDVLFKKTLSFPASTNSPFIARMWASEKIDYLLEEISIYGENPELKQAVIDLSIKYNFVTPYTSMVTTGIVQNKTVKLASKIKLCNNFPNPFIGQTAIKFEVPRLTAPKIMTLKIFDARGRVIRTLVNELTMGGSYSINWNSQDNAGKILAPGLYIAVLSVGNEHQMITMNLLK